MDEKFKQSIVISIIIPTFNRKEILSRCLISLINQTFPQNIFEILVVDDGSTDNIEELIKSFNKDQFIRYLRQERCGQASAENMGIKNARGNIILLLDNDMIATDILVEEHFKYHQKFKNHIVRGAYANTSDYDNPASGSEGEFHSTAFFIAGNVSIRKEHLIKAGMFDEDFKEYGWLDLELGMRLKKLGLSAITNEKAFSYHYQKKFELEDFSKICNKEIERGHTGVLFYRKHPCLRVRMATMNPLLVFIGKLLYKFDWKNPGRGGGLITYLYKKKFNRLLNQIVNLAAISYYVYGVEEALRDLKDKKC